MMSMCVQAILLILLSLLSLAEAYLSCGIEDCYGWSAYCCGVMEDECCDYSVYQFWWFWLVWLSIFMIIVSCSCWCYRRRARPRYVTITNGTCPPTYGTVVVAGPPAYPAQQYQYNGATAPQQPPTYQEKPPAYVP